MGDDVAGLTRVSTRWERLRGWAVTASVVAVCVLPLSWPRDRDSFPLSSYPMFSERRDDTSVQLVVAVFESEASLEVLPTEATGHRQLTQAVRALRQAVDNGGDRPARLCGEVAAWVARSLDAGSGRVGIVTVVYDAIDYLVRDQRGPTIVADHAWCPVTP